MTTTVTDFSTLHATIIAGEASAPSRLSSQGRAYRKWLKDNKRQARKLEQARQRADGDVVVHFDESFSSPKAQGFTGASSGRAGVVSGPQEWQTTTNLGGGFSPNVVGAPAPMIGTPLGRHVTTGSEIGCDPMAWFREGIIANPSAFVLSLPGLGKSTLTRKMLMGHVAQRQVPIIAGDIKGEYVGFTHQVGGQVITIGHGEGHLNPLDVGALGRVIPLLEANADRLAASDKADLVDRAREQVHGRQVTMVTTLVSLGCGEPIADWEAMLISVALREMYQSQDIDWANPPVLADLIEYMEAGSDSLRHKGRARTDDEWAARIDNLMLSLNALLDGATGRIFTGQTTTPID
ncbi:ATP/GTP-binding protein, partial [Corynebacterium belfantii]